MDFLLGLIIFVVLTILIVKDRNREQSDKSKKNNIANRESPPSNQKFQDKQEKSRPKAQPDKTAFQPLKKDIFTQAKREFINDSHHRKQNFNTPESDPHTDKPEQDVLKNRGDGYELHIGRKFELKGDLVIYNGFIRGYEDQGVDVIVIPKVGQEINLIQCKHWKRFEFTEDHLNEIYRKLNTYERDYQMIEPDKINHYLSLKKSDNEIITTIKASLAFHQLRKTLYLSSGQVVQNSVWHQLEKINDRIYRYKDMKIVIHGIG